MTPEDGVAEVGAPGWRQASSRHQALAAVAVAVMLSTAMAGCGSATEFEPPDSSAVELIVVSDGGPDALSLEWTGGPPDAAKWQYRVKAWMKDERGLQTVEGDWGPWTEVPGGASARSYRLGLDSDIGYQVQVRPVVGAKPGKPSNVGVGVTYPLGTTLYLTYDQVVEGDGRTRWRLPHQDSGFTFVIPNGMRVRLLHSIRSNTLEEVASGSLLTFPTWGPAEEWRRVVKGDGWRHVNALFDQIVASTQRPIQSAWECLLKVTSWVNRVSWKSADEAGKAARRIQREACGIERTMPGWHVQKAFLEGHAVAFERLSGVPRRVRYDSLKAAVV